MPAERGVGWTIAAISEIQSAMTAVMRHRHVDVLDWQQVKSPPKIEISSAIGVFIYLFKKYFNSNLKNNV